MSRVGGFRYIDAEDHWRVSLKKSKPPRFNFKAVQSKRLEALKGQNTNLVTYKGLSLSFLNEFWKNVRHDKMFKGLELFTLKKTISNVRKGTTVSKIESNALEDGTLQLRCKDARTGRIITVSSDDVILKGRKMWTVKDLSQHALVPQTTLSHAPFANNVDHNKQGTDFNGWFVLCSQDTCFEELLLSLREYIKDVGKTPAEVSYFWLDIFCMNRSLLKQANKGREAEKAETFREYDRAMTQVLRLFDTRFVYFTNWTKPKVLSDLASIWNLTKMFENKLTFEILPDKHIASKFATIYDTDDNSIFDTINELDPSGLQKELPFLTRFILEQLITKPQGFLTVKNLLNKNFSAWAGREVEDEMKKVPDSRDRQGMEHFAKFLYKTGNFFRKQNETLVAKSYFKRALENYADLEIHYKEEHESKTEFDEVTLAEQLVVDRVHGGASKVHLYQGLMYISEKQYEKARVEFKRAEKEATKIVTQKANFLFDVSKARVQLYLLIQEYKAATTELESMSLQLRDDRKRTSRLKYADVKFKEAAVFNSKKDYGKAEKFLLEAIQVLVDEVSENSIEVGKFYCELGKVTFRSKQKDKALEHLETALNIYTRVKGTVNEEVAHILHKIGHIYCNMDTPEGLKDGLIHIRRAIETYIQSVGLYSLIVAELQTHEAYVLGKMESFGEAEQVCLKALNTLDEEISLKERLRVELSIKDRRQRENMRAIIYSTRGQLQETTHQYFKAKKSYQKAYEITKLTHGEDAEQTKRRKKRWDKSEETARIAMTIKKTS